MGRRSRFRGISSSLFYGKEFRDFTLLLGFVKASFKVASAFAFLLGAFRDGWYDRVRSVWLA